MRGRDYFGQRGWRLAQLRLGVTAGPWLTGATEAFLAPGIWQVNAIFQPTLLSEAC